MNTNNNLNAQWKTVGVLLIFIYCLTFLYLSKYFLNLNAAFVNYYDITITDEMSYTDVETSLRCLNYTPIVDKKGNTTYETLFISNDYKYKITCILNENQIRDIQSREKDAKYEGTLKVVYAKDIFERKIDNFEDLSIEEVDKEIHRLFTAENLKPFFGIYDVDFAYSKQMQSVDTEEDCINSIIDSINVYFRPLEVEENNDENVENTEIEDVKVA